jgi:hypothetical protein
MLVKKTATHKASKSRTKASQAERLMEEAKLVAEGGSREILNWNEPLVVEEEMAPTKIKYVFVDSALRV